jgi:hypothetical protein
VNRKTLESDHPDRLIAHKINALRSSVKLPYKLLTEAALAKKLLRITTYGRVQNSEAEGLKKLSRQITKTFQSFGLSREWSAM